MQVVLGVLNLWAVRQSRLTCLSHPVYSQQHVSHFLSMYFFQQYVCCRWLFKTISLVLNVSGRRYEGLFYVGLCFVMFSWLEMEVQQCVSSSPVDKVRLKFHSINPLEYWGNCSATSNVWSWYTGSAHWRVACYIWYSKEGTGRGCSPPSTLLAVPNVTTHRWVELHRRALIPELSWVELRRRRHRHFADATQLNSTSSWVELWRYKRALSNSNVT